MRFASIVSTALLGVFLSFGALADPMARGKDAAEAFLRGDAAAVWAGMSPDMQRALGSTEALAKVREELRRTFGEQVEVLSENVARQGPYEVYQRVARWSEAAQPVQTVVAFDENERIAGFFVRPQAVAADSPHLDYRTKAPLRLPFEGAWQVFWGGRSLEDNYHAADAGQRFALDLLVVKDGSSHAGDPARLDSYHCWDRPILAPADGVAVRVIDGLADQAIGSSDPRHPAGNHVVIDFGNGEYGFLAHLKRGSVRVRQAQRVRAGMEIGRCGNSGNTSEPHLHFHLQDSPELGRGLGLPAQFNAYVADGVPVERGEPTKGQTIRPAE